MIYCISIGFMLYLSFEFCVHLSLKFWLLSHSFYLTFCLYCSIYGMWERISFGFHYSIMLMGMYWSLIWESYIYGPFDNVHSVRFSPLKFAELMKSKSFFNLLVLVVWKIKDILSILGNELVGESNCFAEFVVTLEAGYGYLKSQGEGLTIK